MRLILTFLILFAFRSCKTGQTQTAEVSNKTSVTFCPEDGSCKLEVLKNSELNINTDEFGIRYPKVRDGKYIVLKFEYKRNEIPNTSDSGYSELIYLELDPNSMEKELGDKRLSDVKLLFGRLCFCRGQTGYYRIHTGNLSIKEIEKNEYQINLQFSTDEVPQVITKLNETIQL